MKKSVLLFLLFISFFSVHAQDVVYEVPYNDYFQTKGWKDRYIVVDADQDGKTWIKEVSRISHVAQLQKADDWLFLPAIHLEANKAYQICLTTRVCSIYDPGLIEIKVGKRPEVEAMTQTVKRKFKVSLVGELQISENRCFTVEDDDVYYFGIHNMSDKNSHVEIYEIDVEPGIVPESPEPVIDLNVKPDPVGHRWATVSFYAPIDNMAREAIPQDATIDYIIDDQWVGSSLPGEYVEFQVGVEKNDMHEFRVVPVLNGNPGIKLRLSDYVGVDYPIEPTNFNVEIKPDGLYFTWDPVPTVGYYGHPVIPEEVGYTVLAADEDRCREGYIGTEDDINMHQTSFFFECDYYIWEGLYWFCVAAMNEKGFMTSPWKKVVIDPDAIASISNPSRDETTEIYDLSGQKRNTLLPGINIIRKDGVVKKVMQTK